MNERHQVDVAILGTGCTGLFLARELRLRGIRFAILGEKRHRGYASTRNQGWLQSGSFYAISNRPFTAQACREGYQEILKLCPSAVSKDVPSYALFKSQEALIKAEEDCALRGIAIEDVTDAVAANAEANNPLLKNTVFEYLARTEDYPVDTSTVLSWLVSDALDENSLRFVTNRMDGVSFLRPKDLWQITTPENVEISAKVLVLACGAYIPTALGRAVPELRTLPPRLTKAIVLVLKCTADIIPPAIVMAPGTPGAPTVVPFYDSDRTMQGVSVYLRSVPLNSLDDHRLPDRTLEDSANQLESFFPALKDIVPIHEPEAHFYTCQLPLDTCRLEWYFGDDQLVMLYPGKFTASPVAAKKCAEKLFPAGSTEGQSLEDSSSSSDSSFIAQRPYFAKSPYRLRLGHSGVEGSDRLQLIFDEVEDT
ncbi:FAD-dependent oxidoreductase [Streptomyces graminilatus]|uniref:FAD-dependent oxidoreductase n=1 Tax=Streptomyces graminilatus TaxID=1464070 RepID=UPI00099ED236|nr:FAD-dependent oxidoreductase [Streptomyces graminilatus]